jgi:type I restriction enzyme M protein
MTLVAITPNNDKELLPEYLYEILRSMYMDIRNLTGHGERSGLNMPIIRGIQIPLPPLSIQQDIVAEIEGYQKIIDGAKAVVENYKPKIELDQEWEMVELGEICDVRDGTHDSPKYVEDGGIPFITQKNITKNGLSFEDVNYISEQDHLQIIKRSNVEYGDIIFSMIGANRGMSCLIDDKRIFSIKNVGLIKSLGKIDQKYLLTYLQSANALSHVALMSTGGAQSFISLKTLRTFPIPVPGKETQQQIVTKIEKEQALVNASKHLIEIFEQKIKDRIAKVWGADKKVPVVYEENDMLTMAAEPEVNYEKKK